MRDLHGHTYYELLGVDAKATPEEILSAHRRRVRRLHPDLFSDLERPFTDHFDGLTALLNAARDTLLDPRLRARYDAQLLLRRGAGPYPGDAPSSDDGTGHGRPGGPGNPDHGAKQGGSPPKQGAAGDDARGTMGEERERDGERAARERRERMVRGEGGLAARLAYSTPPAVQTVALTVAASWLYSVSFFVLWQAGLALAGFLMYGALPLVCWRVRYRWGRLTARVSWPNVRRWEGFAPYNRRWVGRGLLEAGALGAPVALAGALLPYGSLVLALAGLASVALGVLWAAALLHSRG